MPPEQRQSAACNSSAGEAIASIAVATSSAPVDRCKAPGLPEDAYFREANGAARGVLVA